MIRVGTFVRHHMSHGWLRQAADAVGSVDSLMVYGSSRLLAQSVATKTSRGALIGHWIDRRAIQNAWWVPAATLLPDAQLPKHRLHHWKPIWSSMAEVVKFAVLTGVSASMGPAGFLIGTYCYLFGAGVVQGASHGARQHDLHEALSTDPDVLIGIYAARGMDEEAMTTQIAQIAATPLRRPFQRRCLEPSVQYASDLREALQRYQQQERDRTAQTELQQQMATAWTILEDLYAAHRDAIPADTIARLRDIAVGPPSKRALQQLQGAQSDLHHTARQAARPRRTPAYVNLLKGRRRGGGGSDSTRTRVQANGSEGPSESAARDRREMGEGGTPRQPIRLVEQYVVTPPRTITEHEIERACNGTFVCEGDGLQEIVQHYTMYHGHRARIWRAIAEFPPDAYNSQWKLIKARTFSGIPGTDIKKNLYTFRIGGFRLFAQRQSNGTWQILGIRSRGNMGRYGES